MSAILRQVTGGDAEAVPPGAVPPTGAVVRRELQLPAPGSAGPFPLWEHRRWHLGTLAGLLILAVYQSGLWTGDVGERLYLGPDPAMCAWLQTTVSGNLLHHPWRPFDGNVYHPQPRPTVYANLQLGPALLVTPLRAFTDNPVLLDNAGTLLTLLATGYTLFLLAWWLWGDPGAALSRRSP